MAFISTASETLFAGLGNSRPGLRDWEYDVDGRERSREKLMRKCGRLSLNGDDREDPDQISLNSFKTI